MKHLSTVRKYGSKVLAVAGLSGLASSVFAAGEIAALTAGISFTDVITGIFAVAATLIAVYVAQRGITMIIGMVRRGG